MVHAPTGRADSMAVDAMGWRTNTARADGLAINQRWPAPRRTAAPRTTHTTFEMLDWPGQRRAHFPQKTVSKLKEHICEADP